MPSFSQAAPLGAIRSGVAGRNMRTGLAVEPVRPSGISSVTVVPTVYLGSVPAFLPSHTSTDASLLR